MGLPKYKHNDITYEAEMWLSDAGWDHARGGGCLQRSPYAGPAGSKYDWLPFESANSFWKGSFDDEWGAELCVQDCGFANDITVINEWKIRSILNYRDYQWSVVTQNGTPRNTMGVAGHYSGWIISGFA